MYSGTVTPLLPLILFAVHQITIHHTPFGWVGYVYSYSFSKGIEDAEWAHSVKVNARAVEPRPLLRNPHTTLTVTKWIEG